MAVLNEPPRSQKYRDLCHVLVMSKTESFEASLDALIAAIIAQSSRPGGLSENHVRHEVQATFGANLPQGLVTQALRRLAERREVIHIRATDTYAPEPDTRARIERALAAARELEDSVRRDWLASLKPPVDEKSETGQELWAMILEYAARAFRRHGSEVQMLINPDPRDSMPGSSLGALLKSAIARNCKTLKTEAATDAAFLFFSAPDAKRTQYITSLLDATFTVYALGADKGLASYLRGLTEQIYLFVDTNFIFAILGLHENALVEVSKELVELVGPAALPISLIVHRDTMREFQYLVDLARRNLIGRAWSPAVSRALLQTDDLSAIVRRFHEQNARQPTDVSTFFLQFSQAVVLQSLNAKMYRRKQPRDDQEIADLRTKEADYRAYVIQRGIERTPDAIVHDVSVVNDVARLQRHGSSALSARALFLTTDYRLFDFDWSRWRTPGTVGTAILPSQFMQLLRPFVPVSEDFDVSFVKTFALPEVRIANADHSKAIAMLGSLLSALPGVDEKLAVRVVTDDALVNRLIGLINEPDEFTKAVTDTIGLENRALVIERDTARAEASRLAAELAESRKHEAEVVRTIEAGIDESSAIRPSAAEGEVSIEPIAKDQNSAGFRKSWFWTVLDHPRAALFIAAGGTVASLLGGVIGQMVGLAAFGVVLVIVLGTGISLVLGLSARARLTHVIVRWPITITRR